MTHPILESPKSMAEFELGVAAQVLLDAILTNQKIDPDTMSFVDNAVNYWWGKYMEEIDVINTNGG